MSAGGSYRPSMTSPTSRPSVESPSHVLRCWGFSLTSSEACYLGRPICRHAVRMLTNLQRRLTSLQGSCRWCLVDSYIVRLEYDPEKKRSALKHLSKSPNLSSSKLAIESRQVTADLNYGVTEASRLPVSSPFRIITQGSECSVLRGASLIMPLHSTHLEFFFRKYVT